MLSGLMANAIQRFAMEDGLHGALFYLNRNFEVLKNPEIILHAVRSSKISTRIVCIPAYVKITNLKVFGFCTLHYLASKNLSFLHSLEYKYYCFAHM
jgi:hypothetical protein